MKVIINCVLPTSGLVSSGGPTAALETDVLRLLARSCGTAFQQMDIGYEHLSWHIVSNLLNFRLLNFSYLPTY